ncbi:transpeptidase involved in septal peptidoglycan synthesis (penicillin-binding protein 3) [Candidatus Propionivibrio aalborgensis]|uniref:Peptidoglycan D,D-transpeptidase FtsI n=1 Tax=Candidatus Propionivibrio aalborgensis TaxID=1860101 RepID=A0A1A8XHI0_9RHOO|nr:penicillin-binding protein 2 [Candidatus Propionivibrio aalborgensis]SBT03398.1 transpeptidase involved in septal peptidoglycan synthesis (penicillin-binding protein 3) [Candidatus Propionivibrio aalborgensis]
MMNFSGARAHKFAESPVLKLRLPAWRSRLMALLILTCFATLIGRSFYLQVLNNDFLKEKGESRYLRDLEISASRGSIADRHGDVLAISTPMKSVWAMPADARLSQEQTKLLARLLEMDIKELSRKLASDKSFVFLKRQLPPDVAEQVAAQKLPGIGQDKEYRRFYPSGEMTAHIVGFTGIDDKGLEGVELAFQGQLLGHPGSRRVIKDRRGQIVEDVGSIKLPQDGKDIRLALDSKIQYLAYSRLKQAVVDFKAKAGGVVVVDVNSGEILALANWPTYNPNNRERLSGAQLRNRAVTDTFEPGSTLKPFSVALALESGKVRFDTVINCAPGRMTIGNATISDAHPHDNLTVAQVIQKSSNVGTVKIASALTPKQMWGMFEAVGFGQVSQLGFPGEVSGRLRPWKSWRPIEQATMSYGHGISVSLMQLARAYTVFAREGNVVPLSLTKVDSNPVEAVQVFSQQTVREMRAMLEMAVQAEGTAPKAQIPGYRVAGKTGTAYKLEGGQYVRKYVASFVGFAPVSNPRLVVAIMIDEPGSGQHYGGDVAGPVFSKVMGGALRTLGIAQDAAVQVTRDEKDESGKLAKGPVEKEKL